MNTIDIIITVVSVGTCLGSIVIGYLRMPWDLMTGKEKI